jgi:hypothetical protein
MDQETVSAVMSQMGKKGGKVGGRTRMESLTPEERSALAKKAAARSAEVRSAKKEAARLNPRSPGSEPSKVDAAPPRVSPKVHKRPDSRPLTRTQGLNVAADVIQSLRGYRKTPDYRTLQSDLNFLCEVLQRASAGETKNIARLE